MFKEKYKKNYIQKTVDNKMYFVIKKMLETT